MKLLEVELDLQEPISLLRAIDKFMGREMIIKDALNGVLRGKPTDRKRSEYTFRTYPDKRTVTDFKLDYRDLQMMQVENPTEEDYRKAGIGYQEVTANTIKETLKWANRVRT